MIQYITIIIQFALFLLAIFWINRDIKAQGINTKIYWIWAILFIAAMVFMGTIGLVVVLLAYYVWSRHIH